MSIEWGVPGRASVLVDGQFGSTGKGVIAAYLAGRCDYVNVATTAAGANSGHTTKYRSGHSYVAFHLPTTGIERTESLAYINAGAIVHIPTLEQELRDCGVDPLRLLVHPRAAVITDEHIAAERRPDASTTKLASTQHGIGAALSDKIWRRSPLMQGVERPNWLMVGSVHLNDMMQNDRAVVIIETPQGAGLGLNHGWNYPACTSRDCVVSTSLDYAAVHPSFLGPVCMLVRSYPIRVGHIVNEHGEQLGNSGPFYPDSTELDWARDFPHLEPERTTVTKRVRRIATFSQLQYEAALRLNRPTIVALNFANYLPSALALGSLVRKMRATERQMGLRPDHVFGFSACVDDVVDDLDEALAWYDKRSI